MNILWFTDAHVSPGQDQSRFTALGNLIVDKRPDCVINGGDFASIDSLSDWDKDKRRKMEHRRYHRDMGACNEAVSLMFNPLEAMQKRDRKNKVKQYRPDVVWLEGNHEYRIERYIDYNPVIEGSIHYEHDLDFGKVKFDSYEFVPFKSLTDNTFAMREGVAFTHAPRHRAGLISSKYICSRALTESFECSVVFGHTHRFTVDSLQRIGGGGNPVVHHALNGGCFFEENPEYAAGNMNDYWKGVFLLEVKDGMWWIKETWPMEKLKAVYGV